MVTTKHTTRKIENPIKRKNESHDCFLPRENGTKVLVCRKMFLATFDIKEDSFRRWTRDESMHLIDPENVDDKEMPIIPVPVPSASNKREEYLIRRSKVKEWLDSLPKVDSHYCRQSSRKIYVEPLFRSSLHMHQIYTMWCGENGCQPVSRQVFCEILDQENIAIFKPRKDQCDVCASFSLGHISQEDYDEHIIKKNEAQQAKKQAKELANEGTLVVTMDVQSVLLAPKLQASAVYYKKKIQLHNFTIYELNNSDVTLYVWNETDGGVTSNEFTSCIVDYIEGKPHKHFILISDGCGYQNRNKTLSSALSDLAHRKKIIIEQYYLEKGHTQMEADSVHSTLEHYFIPPIYAPCDYISRMRIARPEQPYAVKVLDYTFFKEYDVSTNFSSIRPGKRVGDPLVTDIRALRYTSSEVEYKLKHSESYKNLPQRRQTLPGVISHKKLYKGPVPISKDKFQNLQELKSVVDSQYHSFYDNIIHQ